MGLITRVAVLMRDAAYFGPGFAFAVMWQRLTGRTVTVKLHGRKFVARSGSDLWTVRQIHLKAEYAIHTAHFAQQLKERLSAILAAGDRPVIVDAGANVGAASAWFANQYPDAAIVAIEPDPGNAAMIRTNLGDLGQVTILEAAIGATPGFVSTVPAETAWAIQTERASAGIPVVTVKQAVDRVERGRLFIAKIDIEGFEEDLFASETDWIDEAELVIVEPHDWMLPARRTSRNMQREMGRRSFAMLLNGENLIYVRDRDQPGAGAA